MTLSSGFHLRKFYYHNVFILYWRTEYIHFPEIICFLLIDASFDDEDVASDIGISMATGTETERERQAVYYNTCVEMSRTRLACKDLASALKLWRVNPTVLIKQFEVCHN